MNNSITQNQLKDLLHYDPDTGLFTWNVAKSNKTRVGSVAGHKHIFGYIIIRIDGVPYPAHRIAWLYMTGDFPKEDMDHINGIRHDNRFKNLREATRQQNNFHSSIRSNNTTGFKGVTPKAGKFIAQATLNGKKHYLGFFLTKELASEAYQKFAAKNHGEFYCARGVKL